MPPNINDMFIARFLKNWFLEHKPSGKEVLLDLGCGSIPYRDLYSSPMRLCLAVDAEARVPNIHAIASACALPFPDSTVDIVVFSEVLEHLVNPEQALREIHRVLAEGGILLLTVPFIYGIHESPNDYWRPTEFGLVALLSRCGYKVERFQRRGDVIGVWLILIQQLLMNILRALSKWLPFGRFLVAIPEWLMTRALHLASLAYFRFWRASRIVNPAAAGMFDGSVERYLASWSLGYCAAARKVAS